MLQPVTWERPTPEPIHPPLDGFAALLGCYRRRADLSANELARAVGCSPSYVSRIERGEREPPRRAIVLRLAMALRLRPGEPDRLMLSAGHAPTWLVDLAACAVIHPREEPG